MARILGHFSDDDHNDRGVESGHELYFLFLYCLVQNFLLFVCWFIVVYSLVKHIEKTVIADGSPLSVDAPALSSQTPNKKQITKIFDIFATRRILRSFD